MNTSPIIKKTFSKKELSSLQKKIVKSKYKTFHTTNILGSNLADIYFIHNNQIFNCSIMSLKGDYMEKVSDIVFDKVREMYPKYYDFHFEPANVKEHPDCSVMVKDHNYNENDVNDYQDKLYEEICKSENIMVRERIEVDSSYGYGIGISVFVDKEYMTLSICNKIINIISKLPCLYDGIIYLGEPKTFTHKESKNHKILGCALDMVDKDINFND